MSILKVAKLGNPVLRQISKPVPKQAIQGHTIQRLIKDMVATMREYGGVGLAAPQVHESVQIAVIEGLEGTGKGKQKATQLQVLINPALTVVSDELVMDWEGCLSIPDLRGQVPRYREIQVRALGAEGDQVDFRAAGFHARVIQHEHDHLIGKIFLDRMHSLESLSFLVEFTRYWQDKSDESKEGSP
jgi:peptide deformylase